MIYRRRALFAALAAAALIGGCGGSGKQYTQKSIRTAFVTPADLGKGAISVEDDGHGSHIIYTPPDSVPTCPYVQRADDTVGTINPAVELTGGNSTGRFIVGSSDQFKHPLPVVTQGAVVFANPALAGNGMKHVNAEAAKCPAKFTVIGGPPEVVGNYTVNTRPYEVNGWKGFSQQLAHTSPPDVNPDTYDDLVTVVLQKSNAIFYAGFAQVKRSGQRADSGVKAQAMMKKTLSRLG